ncbi:MAG: Sulfate transport system permease protein CysW [Ktedonobacterales bacterium]|jgi:sulfate transport system permease protein|nr:MAG: Sulfate transport system permease protein CysW [Ktedonobacterales bacterium]
MRLLSSATITTQPPVAQRMRWLLIGIVVAYVAILILAPVGALIVGAFSHGVGALLATLRDPDAQAAFSLTLQISLITVAVHTIFGTVVAWVLVRHRFRGRRWLNALIDLPFAISPVVVGYIILLLFGAQGLFAPLTDALNIQVAFAVPGMVLATLFVTLPLMIREVAPLLQSLDQEPEHAAATLGASAWRTFWRVTFPALRWGIFYGVALTFARALGEFGAVLVVGGDIQGSTETAPLYIFRALDNRNDSAAFSVALVLGLLSLTLVFGIERLRKRARV